MTTSLAQVAASLRSHHGAQQSIPSTAQVAINCGSLCISYQKELSQAQAVAGLACTKPLPKTASERFQTTPKNHPTSSTNSWHQRPIKATPTPRGQPPHNSESLQPDSLRVNPLPVMCQE